MKKLIIRFIIWYLLRHNAVLRYENKVVRVFTQSFYDDVMQEAMTKTRSKYHYQRRNLNEDSMY